MYNIALAPGIYRIEAEFTGPGKTKDLPADVTIQKSEHKRLDTCIEIAKPNAQPSAHVGVLLGRVALWPYGSPKRWYSEMVPGARIVIYSLDGTEITSVVSGDDGRFNISLPAGTYRVEMPRLPARARFTKNLPAAVTIVRGKQTCLDVLLDTGIR